MKNPRNGASLLLVIGWLGSGSLLSYGQGNPLPDRATLLGTNTAKLEIKLTLDQTGYLPGEAAKLTISIANTTSGLLEVFDPFHSGTGSLEVYGQKTVGGKVTWYDLNPEPLCCVQRSETLPTRFISPGEKIEQVFNSYDSHFESPGPLLHVPETPGDYRLLYNYGNAFVLFTVLPATVELVSVVPLLAPGEETSNGKTYQYPRRTALVVLGAGGMHCIVMPRSDVPGDVWINHDLGHSVSYAGARSLGAYIRIVSSSQPITSLSGAETPQANASVVNGVATKGAQPGKESIGVNWTTADGKESALNLGPDRKPLP